MAARELVLAPLTLLRTFTYDLNGNLLTAANSAGIS
jgi:hypothetical protein